MVYNASDIRSEGCWFHPWSLPYPVVTLDKNIYSTLSFSTQVYIKWVPGGDHLEDLTKK